MQERYCSVCNARKERRFKTLSSAAVLDHYQAQYQHFRLRLADMAMLKFHSFPVRVCEMHFQALDGEAALASPLTPRARRTAPRAHKAARIAEEGLHASRARTRVAEMRSLPRMIDELEEEKKALVLKHRHITKLLSDYSPAPEVVEGSISLPPRGSWPNFFFRSSTFAISSGSSRRGPACHLAGRLLLLE